MLNTAEYQPVSITKDLILSHISEADIFYKYLGLKPKLRTKFRNPFRDDKIPTCAFYFNDSNSLRFKDFTGWCNWGCIDVVMYVERLSFNHALMKIAHDFGLVKQAYSLPNTATIQHNKIQVTREEYSPQLQITSKPFTPLEYEWWRAYGIKPSTLSLYRVKSVSHVWLNGRPIQVSSPRYPTFAYCFDNGKYKVYSPLRTELKWISSVTQHQYQGYDQLDWVGDLLIITKSMKDVMVLREMGYNSIAPHSENCTLPYDFMQTLKKRFSRIVIFFDNDDAGIRGANSIAEEHDIKSVIIPTTYNQKDISDFVKSNNLQQGKILMDKILG